ncbi:geranylgeranyl reductase family protein [Shimia thalassica]|uniref:geranylgeranyl reductase family protein n=1 Tax=Shimia thalassica TaxID=1715693 RepID=UPI0026E41F81|nr:geranylgeranyl reductase family protein [Shimia thalassica]MDO6485894.1 geranylgeranyl reductase family protein [Shimia thalassica]MDO6800523.1 geranylgeranyl reductase family protein [Shimia thalassica]
MTNYDILVIGAGPAGSAAATTAAAAGYRVALLDKASFPRNKLCGGLFTGRSRSYYREIFGEDFDTTGAVTRDAIEFWHEGSRLARLEDVPPFNLTMRVKLDNTLFQHALAAGADDWTGHAIAKIDGGGVTLKDGTRLGASIIIGADGVNSIAAKHLFGKAFDTGTIGFGLEIEASPAEQSPQDQPLRIDFASATWGYGWSFPKQGSTTVGVGGLRSANPDMKDKMSSYLTSLGLDGDTKRFKGHHLPFGDFRAIPGRKNILLAGDAAGLVDPITGEGIAFAMKSGQLAAQSAIKALSQDTPDKALAFYQTSLKEMHRSLWIARNLRRIIFAPQWQSAFTGTFRRSGTVRMMYMQLLAGEMEYPELARAVVRRLPRYVLNRFRR